MPGPHSKLALVPLNVLSDPDVTGHHSHLVEVFRLAVGVLHLLAEHQVELKKEHPPLSRLPDKLLWVPYVESILVKMKLPTMFPNFFCRNVLPEG